MTKDRRKVINNVILERLLEHFARLLKAWEREVLEFNGEAEASQPQIDHGTLS